jgi:hypothetical protein
MCTRFRASLRLIVGNDCVKCVRLPSDNVFRRQTVTNAVHRYAESIAGRDYLIEVKAVAHDRWRAYRPASRRATALMPFYVHAVGPRSCYAVADAPTSVPPIAGTVWDDRMRPALPVPRSRLS